MVFPEMRNKRFGYVNMNEEAKAWLAKNPQGIENPLLDPAVCQRMMDGVHAELALDASYGGWLEDRSTLWQGSYLDGARTYLHLGVDVNVAAGTEVAIDRHAEVLLVDEDLSVGGWGNRVIVQLRDEPVVLIYAHLASGISCAKGDRLSPDDRFARVGEPHENGEWMPHVHVQAIRAEYFQRILDSGKLNELDGYGSSDQRGKLAQMFPDPLQFFNVK